MIVMLISLTSFSQSKSIWKSIKESEVSSQAKVSRNSTPRNFELYQLDLNALKATLLNAPLRDIKGISKIVIESNSQLLVLGAHGHKGIKDLLFGSTVEAVRHKLDIPVLVVK